MLTAFRRFCFPLMIVAIGLAFAVADAAIFSPAPAARAVVVGGAPTAEAFAISADVSIESILGAETIPFTGSVIIERSATRTEGGVEVTDLEIVSLDLTGTSLTGTVLLRESPTLVSAGEIRGLQPSPDQFPASSFIDLFFQAEVPGSPSDPIVLHNEAALHLVPTDSGSEVPLTAWPPEGVTFRADPDPCKPLLPVLPGRVCVTSASFVIGASVPLPTPTPTATFVPTPTLTPTPTPQGSVLKSLEVSALVSVESILGTETIPFTGSVLIERSAPRTEGGVEVTDIEIVSLNLTGTSVTGTVVLRLSPTLVSAGEVRGLQPSPDQFPASSFIDLFFEVEVAGSPVDPLTLHNAEALHLVPMEAGSEVPLTAWPPDGVTFRADPDPCKPLLPVLPGLVCVTSAAFVLGGSIPTPTPTPTAPLNLEGPSFSVAQDGPSALHPAAVLDRDPAVRVAAPCVKLGLTADGCDDGADGDQDDVDALSYGHDFGPDAAPVTFSVASGSGGAAASDVATQAACSPAQPQADIFSTALDGSNTLLFDGDGVNAACETATAVGLVEIPESDDIDAFESLSANTIDIELDGEPDAPVFFSLSSGSPSLAALGRGQADILWTVGGTQPGVFAFAATLGLQAGDDIDGLCVADDGDAFFEPGIDAVAFSLAPGSPTLDDLGAGPADLLGPGGELYVTADLLGLAADDDLNAMSCGLGVGPEIVAQAHLDPATQSVNVGEPVVVDVQVFAVNGLGAYEIEIPFDAELVSYVSVENGDLLGSSGRNPTCFGPLPGALDKGIVLYGCVTSGSAPGASGSGLLASVTFEATCATGGTTLDLVVDLVDPFGNPIPVQASGATVTVGGECQTSTPTPTPTDAPTDAPTPTPPDAPSPTPAQAGPEPTETPFTDVLGLPVTGAGRTNIGSGGWASTLATVLAIGLGMVFLGLGARRFRRS